MGTTFSRSSESRKDHQEEADDQPDGAADDGAVEEEPEKVDYFADLHTADAAPIAGIDPNMVVNETVEQPEHQDDSSVDAGSIDRTAEASEVIELYEEVKVVEENPRYMPDPSEGRKYAHGVAFPQPRSTAQ